MKETGKRYAILIICCALRTIQCDTKEDVSNNVKELQERNRRLYGDTRRSSTTWEQATEEDCTYPNGDAQKLAEISRRWIEYYRCTSRMVNSITPSGHLPSINVVVYEGEVARLPCNLCVAPGEEDRVTWSFAEGKNNVTLTRLVERSSTVRSVNVTMYKVEGRDAGRYRCALGGSAGGGVVLEVLDDHQYDVITVESNHHKRSAIPTVCTSKLITSISWSPWSECSSCDRAGRRRRYGICFARLNDSKLILTATASDSIFKEFPDGIACGSWLLPEAYRNEPTIINRKNVIMTESCKKPCEQLFEVRSATGELLEIANNSDGVYSLSQRSPLQPPPPARDVIFTKYGHNLTLKCPGTTLRDMPVTWRRGTKLLGAETGLRVHVNARDQIVISYVRDEDANVYSCWQSTALAGVLKLEVWRDTRLANGRPAAAACLTVVAISIHYAVKVLRSKMRCA